MYVVVSSQNGRTHYLARQRIGTKGYTVIATFLNEQLAQQTADVLNKTEKEQKK